MGFYVFLSYLAISFTFYEMYYRVTPQIEGDYVYAIYGIPVFAMLFLLTEYKYIGMLLAFLGFGLTFFFFDFHYFR